MQNQSILNKRLYKAVVRNDMKDIQRLINLGADVNSEFTIDELINKKLLDNNAVTTIRNAETTVDKLFNSKYMDNITITTLKMNSYNKVIFIPIIINKIILTIESKLSPLQLSIMYGWKEVIVELIKKGANPNKALDIQGITILQLMCTAAVFKDKQCYIFDEEIVQLLFDYGADPNIQDVTGKTFLRYALYSSDFQIDESVKDMMRKMQMKSDSDTSNSDSLNHKDFRRFENFLINGANPNIKDKCNCCAVLYDIVEHDSHLHIQPQLTNLLLDHGSLYSTYKDVLKHPEIVSMMQEEYGRSFNAKNQVDEFNSKHKQHVQKNSQLIEAIKSKDISKVRKILSEGTSPNIRDKDGLSVLHLAVKLDYYAITELLLIQGANSNIKSWRNGTTPLFNAVTSNRLNITELLLKHAANPSVINTKGLSPLYFSITNNNEDMKKLLLKYKANPDISHQISILFDVLNGVKNDNDIEMIKNTLKKIKDITEFLKSKDICVDYSLFYRSVDIAEKNDKKNTAKKVMELLDELTSPMS